MAKSLLLFANPSYIDYEDNTAIDYFKVYGANCFGLDKLSINEKLQ
jgi:DNA-directed RNA polymerase